MKKKKKGRNFDTVFDKSKPISNFDSKIWKSEAYLKDELFPDTHIYKDETWHNYNLPEKDQKIYESRDTFP